ncbi:MAG: hypothetical protein KAY37_11035 [Phycisphaerae bacterium]|nr:hypothetical protein [Phycisphaerae bacterium]
MENEMNPAAKQTRHRRWLWTSVACLAGLAFLAGCATNPKGTRDAPQEPPAAEKTPAATPAEPAPAPAPDEPEAAGASAAPQESESSAAERQAIREMIHKKIQERTAQQVDSDVQKDASAAPKTPASEPRADASASNRPHQVTQADLLNPPARETKQPPVAKADVAGASNAPTPRGTKPQKPKSESSYKKGTPGKLTPPPPDAPQPKYVCQEPKITRDDIWKGQKAKFEFVLANEGEGPLQIKLKGG